MSDSGSPEQDEARLRDERDRYFERPNMASNLTPHTLADTLYECGRRWPTATIRTNQVGNLVVIVDGTWVAYIDLYDGEVNEFTRLNS